MPSIKQQSNFVNNAVYSIERIGRSLAVNSIDAADVAACIVASATSSNSLLAPIAAGLIAITSPLWKQTQTPKFTAPIGYFINWHNFVSLYSPGHDFSENKQYSLVRLNLYVTKKGSKGIDALTSRLLCRCCNEIMVI